jgi:hypothetical protein
MKDVRGAETLTAIIPNPTWTQFRIVRRLCWSANRERPWEYDVLMTVETEDTKPRCQLTAVFAAVRDFRFAEAGARETRIVGLNVLDVSSRQWEGVNWEVTDYDDDDIRFVCRDIQLTDIKTF